MGVGWGWGQELMSGPASLLLSRVFCICGRNIQKTRDNKAEAGPDMSSYPLPHPTPIVAQILFFVFFCFLDGFAMLLGRTLWFFGFVWFSLMVCYLCVQGYMVALPTSTLRSTNVLYRLICYIMYILNMGDTLSHHPYFLIQLHVHIHHHPCF